MKKLSNSDKINLIRKQFKHNRLLIEIVLENYENCDLYIRLYYDKKKKEHYICWCDLNLSDNKNIINYLNYEFVPYSIFSKVVAIIQSSINKTIEYRDLSIKEDAVMFNLYYGKNSKEDVLNILFHRYIPKELPFLAEVFINIFNILPKRLESFLKELCALLTGDEQKYEYTKMVPFDLKCDDINELIKEEEVSKGKILNLEYVHDKYIALLKDKDNYYSVIITNDEKEKKAKLNCTCGVNHYCGHIRKVIEYIRKNKEKKFYKVTYDNTLENTLDKIIKFNFFLCGGIINDELIIVNEDGFIEFVKVYNAEGKNYWKVIEDDKNNSLTKKLEKVKKD